MRTVNPTPCTGVPQPIESGGETVFRTDVCEKPSGWSIVPSLVAAGAIIGLIDWVVVDRTLSWGHVLLHPLLFALIFSLFALPQVHRTLLREIRVTETGFCVVDGNGRRYFAWSELQAARFQAYPIVNMRTSTHCFTFVRQGRNHQIELDGLSPQGMRAFRRVAEAHLRRHSIPSASPHLRTFGSLLSHTAAWVFVMSLVGMLFAHAAVLDTLGLTTGLAFMSTAIVMAMMSFRERLSRFLIAASLIFGAVLFVEIRYFHIDMAQVFDQ